MSNRSSPNYVRELLAGRARFTDYAISAVFLALAINLLASLLSARIGAIWTAGLALLLLGFALGFIGAALMPRYRRAHIRAVLLLDTMDSVCVAIPDYFFSEQVGGFVERASLEDPTVRHALQSHKEREDLLRKVLSEAVEYYLLYHLSEVVRDRFAGSPDESELAVYDHHSLPGFLAENRFLSLFSRPVGERPAWAEHLSPEELVDLELANVIMAQNPDGRFFYRFALTLPKDAKLDRGPEGGLFLESPLFRLDISPTVETWGVAMPRLFEVHYVGRDPSGLLPVACDLQLEFRLKGGPWSLFRRYRRYSAAYSWVDEYTAFLSETASWDVFLDKVSWPTIRSLIRVMGLDSDDAD